MSTFTTALFFIVFIVAAFWLVKKIWFKKKAPTQDTKDNKKDADIPQANTNLIKVLIWRSMSDGLVAQAGNPIICEEKRDTNNNLIVTNEDAKFKEDFSFSIDRIYEVMNFSLKVHNKTNHEKAEVLRKEIKIQEQLIMDIEADVELNKDHNYNDEMLKLRQLKVFYNSLRREKTGNYMRLGMGGIRQFEFVAVDGVLYPYFFGSKWFRVYPDLQVKKKIFNHENSVFKMETAALLNNAMNWIQVITIALGLVMMGIGASMMYYTHNSTADITMTANQGAITCTNTLATINKQYGDALVEYMQGKKTETNINNQNNNINIPKIDGVINVDPTKITR